MNDIGLIACLILIPLTLRWITAWQIKKYQGAALKSDADYKKIAIELNEIREAIHQVERQQSHYAAKRSLIYGQIEEARTELAKLRRPAQARIATRIAA